MLKAVFLVIFILISIASYLFAKECRQNKEKALFFCGTSVIALVVILLLTFSLNPNRNAKLETLEISDTNISEDFSPNKMRYNCDVDNSVDSVVIEPVTKENGATYKIISKSVSKYSSKKQDLNIGENNFEITVTAPNGKTQKTYKVVINRKGLENKQDDNRDNGNDSKPVGSVNDDN